MPLETKESNNKDSQTVSCQNCFAPTEGPFCSRCGQEVESRLTYFWTVILHILDDIFSFDSRAARTVKPLLINPGFLTNQYILGRRVFYVPPIKLYLFVSVIFFISLKFISFTDDQFLVHKQRVQQTSDAINKRVISLEQEIKNLPIEQQQLTREQVTRFNVYQEQLSPGTERSIVDIVKRMADIELRATIEQPLSKKRQAELDELAKKLIEVKAGADSDLGKVNVNIGNTKTNVLLFSFLSDEANKRLNEKVQALEQKAENAINTDARPLAKQSMSKLPQLMFVLLPFFALILKIFYLFSNRLYLEHLTVALHSHSFIFSVFLLLNLTSIVQEYCNDSFMWLSSGLDVLSVLLFIWIPIYLFIMQKRVYKQGNILTVVKFCVVSFAYINMIAITSIIAFIWGLTDI
ncbi:DUF3667 domain-containing protein [Thalassotalea atypica]|uniref:DUF3667 domain-containing protein n=1 Tax=Thalassotalea atypica TaxID=2054316 RepID=UPI002573C2A1|nr:DUF3667 domain-containing protein [Thalassotalea atypica]